ncbi:2-deoxyribonucleoside glycosidase [Motiliproteus coralliicola]|uniref:2-deoxyribonucleoside glycosidase n=1 Tax=Motiliproteus coralliicola TaxID=2283196 RepID=A0A369WXN3_9GAMM|nr:nucleoside 2-deoxyribosyltransferase [Motiliproteus coralliicola]RDE24265.1 2-deoxyribonucleoside glycosidase [Motiliproteus coralliicola]
MAIKIYLAGPLGFSEVGRMFHYECLIPALEQLGLEPLDPWQLGDTEELRSALALSDLNEQRTQLAEINRSIGRTNVEAIDRCDWILANLDGVDVDSGTAAEIGYGFATGKLIFGYRGDFRLSCDNLGGQVNLQVEYFIRASGGLIASDLESLLQALQSAGQ